MKKQKTAKFTRTQDALHAAKSDMGREERGGKGDSMYARANSTAKNKVD